MRIACWIMLSVCCLLLCCGLIEAGAREKVAVAQAVDSLLQSNTPALPDSLGGDRESPFVPVDPDDTGGACACGCGRSGCQCGRAAGAAGCSQATIALPFVTLYTEAIDVAVGGDQPTAVTGKPTLYVTRTCPACPWYQTNLAGLVTVEYVDNGWFARNGQAQIPALRRADGAWWNWQAAAATPELVKPWITQTAVASEAPVNAGFVDMAGLKDFLPWLDGIQSGELRGKLPDTAFAMNGAAIHTNAAGFTLTADGRRKALTFGDPLPHGTYSFVKLRVEGIELTPDKVYVRLKSAPDWTLDVLQ